MKNKKKLAEAEWQIMDAIWQHGGPVTVRQVHSRLFPDGRKAYTTVQTIMNILAEKGFLTKEKIGMVNFYAPAFAREEAAALETQTLASRVFRGSFGAMANYLVGSGELSRSELLRLKNLIDAKQREQEEGGD